MSRTETTVVVMKADEVTRVIEGPDRSRPPGAGLELGSPHMELDRRRAVGCAGGAHRIRGRQPKAGIARSISEHAESQTEVEWNVQWEDAALHRLNTKRPHRRNAGHVGTGVGP